VALATNTRIGLTLLVYFSFASSIAMALLQPQRGAARDQAKARVQVRGAADVRAEVGHGSEGELVRFEEAYKIKTHDVG
jgi:hypothetical protein